MSGSSGQSTQQQKVGLSFLKSMDLFAFLPVPKTAPVSTKRSLYGTFIMFSLFLLYIIVNFIEFIVVNAPRVNQYTVQLPVSNVTLPAVAFGFFFGEPFSKTVNDPTIFSFTMEQVYKSSNVSAPDVKVKIPLVNCTPSWLPDQGYPLLCPTLSTNMSGALYETPSFAYPRININYCAVSSTQVCESETYIAQITAGGRILLFIKNNQPDLDLNTGKELGSASYKVFQFFLIPGLYVRGLVTFESSSFTIFPDYLRRWGKQYKDFLSIQQATTFNTNVTIYNSAKGLQISFQIDQVNKNIFPKQTQDKQKVSLVYATTLDQVSKWGAFWGVLFAAFAAYFLRYNSNHFYDNNKKWSNFDQEIQVKRDTLNMSSTIELSDTQAKKTEEEI